MTEHNQQFDTYDEWLSKGELWMRRVGSTERPVCFDVKGRICNGTVGFMRARDDSAFPVRWLWPSQIPEIINRAENLATAVAAGRDADPAVDDFIAIVPGFAAQRAQKRGVA